MSDSNLLVIGGPGSGKTTYGIQLLHRLQYQVGILQLEKSIDDMSSVAEDSDRMARGLQVNHTVGSQYKSTIYKLIDGNKRSHLLELADYKGEQIRSIGHSNIVPTDWVVRARNSQRWLYLLRVDTVQSRKNFFVNPIETGNKEPEEVNEKSSGLELWTIEVLQRLLFVRGASTRSAVSSPRLAFVLSVWDELQGADADLLPWDLLESRAPLLFNFLRANWLASEIEIFGLSATEKTLPEEKPDLEFAKNGSTKGYIVTSKGERISDLTVPLAWLLNAYP